MISVSYKARGLKNVRKAFARIVRVLSDQRPTMRTVKASVLRDLKRHVATDGRWGGAPWKTFAQSGESKYGAWRQAVHGHQDLLVFDRSNPILKRSVTGGAFHVSQITRSGLRVGTRHPFAVSMYRGGTGPFGEPFPSRKLIATTAAQMRSYVRAVLASIVERVNR